ncbi:MAG TPA: RDD family protein [Bacilli bacterium]|nr:RDD family protein [Bacilli bacterium]
MNASFIKRFLAGLTDIIILGALIYLMMLVFNPTNNENIIKINNEIETLNSNLLEQEVSYQNYVNQYADLMYMLDKEEVMVNVFNVIFIIILYIIIPFITGGSTIGKKLLRIKVVKNNGDKLNLNEYFLRSLLINYLGYLLVTLALIFIVNSFSYFIIGLILILFEILLVIISAFMILYRHDKRGLHDLIAHTKVVNI